MTEKIDMEPMCVINSRVFDAPREAMFDAFADPEKLKHWWGPDGFTNTMHTFEFRPGGTWHFTMHASNGAEFVNTSTFTIVSAPERVVFIHHLPVHIFTMTMTFTPEGTGTRLAWLMQFEPAEGNAALKDFIAAANEQNFDRLEAFLKQT